MSIIEELEQLKQRVKALENQKNQKWLEMRREAARKGGLKSFKQARDGSGKFSSKQSAEQTPSKTRANTEQNPSKTRAKCRAKVLNGFDFEALYRRYPRKVGKAEGLKKAERDVRTREDYELLTCAVDKFLAYHSALGTEARFIPLFSTFMSTWRDWNDQDAGTISGFERRTRGIAELLAEDEGALGATA